MNIRQENKNDYTTIYNLVQTAFETAKVKDGHEQDLVNTLRNSNKYIPELALVAEEAGNIIGHIMLSRTYVKNETSNFEALYLAPASVALEHRNQGVGSKLIKMGMKLATDIGFQAVFLAGDPAYYHRFGFVPTIQHDIKCSIEIPEEFFKNIMVCELVPNALDGVYGIVEF